MIYIDTADVSFLEDKNEYDRCFEMLLPQRQRKVLRMRFEADRRLSVGAGLLLREALEMFGLHDDGLTIAENEYGKPYFPALGRHFSFSISHSGTKAMCIAAFSESGTAPNVGCDVEKISGEYCARIAKRYFAPSESDMINSLADENEKCGMFCRLWTLKESYIKCIGLGFSCPLNSFSLTVLPDGSIKAYPEEIDEHYTFSETDRKDGYRYAWCSEKQNMQS